MNAAVFTSDIAAKAWRIFLWGFLVLSLDLSAKALALEYLNPWVPRPIIPGFFNLVLIHNTGAAFSLFSGEDPNQGLKMAGLALLSLLPFLYFFIKAKAGDRILLTALGLIWGGAAGNIHDRFRYGAVVDFLDFYIGRHHWPAFNVADMAICAGAGLLALTIIREKPRRRDQDKT